MLFFIRDFCLKLWKFILNCINSILYRYLNDHKKAARGKNFWIRGNGIPYFVELIWIDLMIYCTEVWISPLFGIDLVLSKIWAYYVDSVNFWTWLKSKGICQSNIIMLNEAWNSLLLTVTMHISTSVCSTKMEQKKTCFPTNMICVFSFIMRNKFRCRAVQCHAMPHIKMYEGNKFICLSQLLDKVWSKRKLRMYISFDMRRTAAVDDGD